MTLAEMLQQKVTPLYKRKPLKAQRVSRGRAENATQLVPHLKTSITAHDLADKLGMLYGTVYNYLVALLEAGLVKASKVRGARRLRWAAK